jgi:hypothetical protein
MLEGSAMADQNRNRESSGDEMDLDRSKQGSSGSQRGSSGGSSGSSSGRSRDKSGQAGYGGESQLEGIGDEEDVTGTDSSGMSGNR